MTRKTVTITLNRESFSAWDDESQGWTVFPGTYTVSVGGSSRDFGGKASFTLSAR